MNKRYIYIRTYMYKRVYTYISIFIYTCTYIYRRLYGVFCVKSEVRLCFCRKVERERVSFREVFFNVGGEFMDRWREIT